MQTISRATVMLVTLAALAWAAVRFGPIEAIQPLTSRTIELADELLGRPGGRLRRARQPLSRPSWPQPLVLATSRPGNEPLSTISVPLQKVSATGPATRVSVVVAELESLGAQQVAVDRWGQSGLCRISCELPLPGSSSITQHFESVAVNQADAALKVLSEIRAWHAQRNRLSGVP